VRLFKNTWFSRFAKKEGITDEELRETVNQLEAGQADADLGGGVYKVRLARPGEGKSGGYRVIVFLKVKAGRFMLMVFFYRVIVTFTPPHLVFFIAIYKSL
jgi:hypothetical protein